MSINNRAFTLIELIVVVFLIALSASLVFINIKINKSLNQEEVFLKKFIELVNEARVNSIVTNSKKQIIINGEDRTIKISGSNKKIKIPESITISAIQIISKDGKNYINFYPDGSSTGAKLEILGKNFKKNIVIQRFNPKIIIENEEL